MQVTSAQWYRTWTSPGWTSRIAWTASNSTWRSARSDGNWKPEWSGGSPTRGPRAALWTRNAFCQPYRTNSRRKSPYACIWTRSGRSGYSRTASRDCWRLWCSSWGCRCVQFVVEFIEFNINLHWFLNFEIFKENLQYFLFY